VYSHSFVTSRDIRFETAKFKPLASGRIEGVEMSILMVTGIEGARNCADAVSTQLGMEVEVAENRRAAMAILKRREFQAMVVDETMVECDPAAAEAIWAMAGLAIPLQINFALSGAMRLVREIKAALHRRAREQALASMAAAVAIETELKSTVAGLLLHSELALKGSGVPPAVADRMRVVAELAGTLRQQLNAPRNLPALNTRSNVQIDRRGHTAA
jgi:hypothetical protein